MANAVRLTLPATNRALYQLGNKITVTMDVADTGVVQATSGPSLVATLGDGSVVSYTTGWTQTPTGAWTADIMLDFAGLWNVVGSFASHAGISFGATFGVEDRFGMGATGVAMPAGGRGVRGWLSGIYNQLGVAQDRPSPNGIIPVPFRPDDVVVSIYGSGTNAYLRSMDENTTTPIDGDSAGSHVALYGVISASATYANGVVVNLPFFGRVLGLRWLHQSTGDSGDWWQKDLGVSVDGDWVRLDQSYYYDVPFYTRSAAMRERRQMLFDDLEPGPHLLSLHMPCDVSVTRNLALFGLLVEAGAGNWQPPPAAIIQGGTTAIGTGSTWTAVDPRSGGVSAPKLHGLKAVIVRNTNAIGGSACTVQARNYTNSTAYTGFWSQTIQPQQSAVVPINDATTVQTQKIELNSDNTGAVFSIVGVR